MKPEDVRTLFPVMRQRAYLFSGGIAPLSTNHQDAIARFTDALTNDPGELYRRLRQEFEKVRHLFAALVGADEEEVAITDCTGTGSNLAVEMIEQRSSGNVVFDELAYPSSVYPWMLPGKAHLERRFVKRREGVVHLEDLSNAIDDDTVAVSISHVSEQTGFRQDISAVADLAHERGAVLAVDAMQSAGAVDFNVHEAGVDFLSCGAMKWLLGSAGVGFLYAARQHLDKMPPHAGGAGALPDSRPWGEREFAPKQGAERLQLGVSNLIGLAATTPGLEILANVGMDKVQAHVLDLSKYCIDGLLEREMKVITPTSPHQRAGIVAIEMEDCAAADAFLCSRGVDGYHYQNVLRVDPHIFNDRSDIDRFLAELDAYLAQSS